MIASIPNVSIGAVLHPLPPPVQLQGDGAQINTFCQRVSTNMENVREKRKNKYVWAECILYVWAECMHITAPETRW